MKIILYVYLLSKSNLINNYIKIYENRGVRFMVATIVLAGIIFGLMALIIVKQVKKAKSGESSCGCGCSGCSSAKTCHGSKN